MARIMISILLCILIIFPVVSQQKCGRKYADQVLLVSMDGFRWDYVKKVNTPNFDRMAQQGVTVPYVNNTFITKTFPCHYTIVTGLYEESHGIVGNSMYDPQFNETFSMKTLESKWWDEGEPLWVTARKNGLKSGTVFWPGSEAKIRGFRPNKFYPYNQSMPFTERIEIAIDLLKKEEYNFVTLYFHEPDYTGHRHGPDSQQIKDMIGQMDTFLGQLLEQLETNGLNETVNVVLTSDHGMTEIDLQNKVIDVPSLVNDTFLLGTVDSGPIMHLIPVHGKEDAVVASLTNVSHLNVFHKSDIPDFWHYKNNRRIMPVFLVADEGWSITMNVTQAKQSTRKGNHGYDNRLMSMKPMFYAMGPNFRRNYTGDVIRSVDIYPMICEMLGMMPSPNNGSLSNTLDFLVPFTNITSCDSSTPGVNGSTRYSFSFFGMWSIVLLCIVKIT